MKTHAQYNHSSLTIKLILNDIVEDFQEEEN